MPSETIRDGSWYALNIRQKAFQMLFKRPTTLHWTKQPNWRELLNSVINHFSINDHSFFMRKNSNDFIDGLLFYRWTNQEATESTKGSWWTAQTSTGDAICPLWCRCWGPREHLCVPRVWGHPQRAGVQDTAAPSSPGGSSVDHLSAPLSPTSSPSFPGPGPLL